MVNNNETNVAMVFVCATLAIFVIANSLFNFNLVGFFDFMVATLFMFLSFIFWQIFQLQEGRGNMKPKSITWCPDCGDSLETKTIWRADPDFIRIIDHYEYYCFGCDKVFILGVKL
jgi:hypothetical protein